VYIREARPGDGAAIAAVHRENSAYYVGLAPDLFRPPDETGLAESLRPGSSADTSASLFIVAENDEEIVGYLYAELVYPDASARFQSNSDLSAVRLFIHAVGVLQRQWRQGIASALVEAAEAWGRERDATLALCDTWIASPVSIPFWERMGYLRRSVRLRKPLS
jgi:GNAT superfamily N-acetyltransferase